MFGSRVGFSRLADRMDLLPVGANPRWRLDGWPPSWKISNGHISATGHPIGFVFDPREELRIGLYLKVIISRVANSVRVSP